MDHVDHGPLCDRPFLSLMIKPKLQGLQTPTGAALNFKCCSWDKLKALSFLSNLADLF